MAKSKTKSRSKPKPKKAAKPKIHAKPKMKKALKPKIHKKAVKKAAKKHVRISATRREEPEVSISPRIEESVQRLKEEQQPIVVELEKPTIIFDKVYLQNISFEIASIKQTMERVSRQLDKLERQLAEHSD